MTLSTKLYRRLEAIADLTPGKVIQNAPSSTPTSPLYDYSHLLPEEAKKQGYELRLRDIDRREDPNDPISRTLKVKIFHPSQTSSVGYLHGEIFPHRNHEIYVDDIRVDKNHRRNGLGTAAYEALYAHAYHTHGVKAATGGSHSTLASKRHKALAAKHGLVYSPQPSTSLSTIPSDEPGADDEAFYHYTYSLH